MSLLQGWKTHNTETYTMRTEKHIEMTFWVQGPPVCTWCVERMNDPFWAKRKVIKNTCLHTPSGGNLWESKNNVNRKANRNDNNTQKPTTDSTARSSRQAKTFEFSNGCGPKQKQHPNSIWAAKLQKHNTRQHSQKPRTVTNYIPKKEKDKQLVHTILHPIKLA